MKTKQLCINNQTISYNEYGAGKNVIVLLHGYLESAEIWHDFAVGLSNNKRILCIDLPGHGKSSITQNASIEKMAEAAKVILDFLKIKKCFIIGHSMGGYVALAFAENYTSYLTGICLFHSAAGMDTPEKIQNRKREIRLVKEGKKALIFKTHFPNTFAKENLEKFDGEINMILQKSFEIKDEGIIYALTAMMNRPDRLGLLKKLTVKKLWVIGKKDNFIPSKKALDWAKS